MTRVDQNDPRQKKNVKLKSVDPILRTGKFVTFFKGRFLSKMIEFLKCDVSKGKLTARWQGPLFTVTVFSLVNGGFTIAPLEPSRLSLKGHGHLVSPGNAVTLT